MAGVAKFIIGVGRTAIDPAGNVRRIQYAADSLEVDVPDDGSEFLSSIWMIADGLHVLSLPLTVAPVVARYSGGFDTLGRALEELGADVDELDADELG